MCVRKTRATQWREQHMRALLRIRDVRSFNQGFNEIIMPLATSEHFIIPADELHRFSKNQHYLPTVRKVIMKIHALRGTMWQVDEAYIMDTMAWRRAKM